MTLGGTGDSSSALSETQYKFLNKKICDVKDHRGVSSLCPNVSRLLRCWVRYDDWDLSFDISGIQRWGFIFDSGLTTRKTQNQRDSTRETQRM